MSSPSPKVLRNTRLAPLLRAETPWQFLGEFKTEPLARPHSAHSGGGWRHISLEAESTENELGNHKEQEPTLEVSTAGWAGPTTWTGLSLGVGGRGTRLTPATWGGDGREGVLWEVLHRNHCEERAASSPRIPHDLGPSLCSNICQG